MNNQVREILEELYQIDVSLKNHENDLIRVIGKMIESKPNTEFSEKFKNELKQRIIKQLNVSKSQKTSTFSNIYKSLLLVMSGAAVASFFIIAIFPQIIGTNDGGGNIAYNNPVNKSGMLKGSSDSTTNEIASNSGTDNQIKELESTIDGTGVENNSGKLNNLLSGSSGSNRNQNIKNPPKNIISTRLAYVKINKLSDNAFGSISIKNTKSEVGGVSSLMQSDAVSSDTSYTSNSKVTAPSAINDSLVAPKALDDVSGVGVEEVNYVYSYTGAIDNLNTQNMPLLKKVTSEKQNNSSLLTYIKNLKLSGINLSNISNSSLSSFEIKDNSEYGLDYQVSLENSKIYITKNTEKWPQIQNTYNEQTKNSQTKITDFPTDSKIISLAKDVVIKYSLDLKNYGDPVVNNDWKVDYMKSENRDNYYLPDTIQVIYPLLLDGKQVFEDYGAVKGLKISFDVKTLKLAEINGIEGLEYESSNYAIENNLNTISTFISKGGRNAYSQYHDSNAKIKNVTIHLSKPKLVLININDYKDGKTIEYYVPSLIFESIEKPKAGEYFQEKVVVPLIKDFFNSSNQIMR